jgi:hypothetical protein
VEPATTPTPRHRESGYLLLAQLGLDGWFTAVIANGEGGVRVIARKFGHRPIDLSGASVAVLAPVVYLEAQAA